MRWLGHRFFWQVVRLIDQSRVYDADTPVLEAPKGFVKSDGREWREEGLHPA